MTSTAGDVPSINDLDPTVEARLSSFNAVFSLSLILTQAASPDQVMRLVTTSVPSIVSCQQALIWHLARSGEYYQRAPEAIGEVLAKLTGPDLLKLDDFPPSWAFPIAYVTPIRPRNRSAPEASNGHETLVRTSAGGAD